MPPKIETETILRIIKTRIENPAWGWKKLAVGAGVTKNTAKKYWQLYEDCDKEEIPISTPRQECKDCNIIYMNATYNECPKCGRKLKIKV